MSVCLNCGGLIMEPGKAYGWAGKTCVCPIHPSRAFQNPSDHPLRNAGANSCGCIGPQDGHPVCPCQMRDVKIVNGRYVRVVDLGPAPQPPRAPIEERFFGTD